MTKPGTRTQAFKTRRGGKPSQPLIDRFEKTKEDLNRAGRLAREAAAGSVPKKREVHRTSSLRGIICAKEGALFTFSFLGLRIPNRVESSSAAARM